MAKKKIADLKFDPCNFNKGSEYGNSLLEKSIQKFGFREAATLDKNGVLVGGNKRTAKAGELGFEDVEIIKGDPKKVYCIQYDDIDMDSKEGKELALALNQTAAKNIILDAEVIEAELGEAVCVEWGVDSFNEKEIDFDDIDSNLDRSNAKPLKEICCPNCNHKFNA
jgi:hypothetical protein